MADPDTPSPLTTAVTEQLQTLLAGPPDAKTLDQALRLLGKWRAKVIGNTLVKRDGHIITHGPFKGMIYKTAASEGGYVPRRLGIYEASLAPVIEAIVRKDYPTILDIGAAEGYYAVGLARRMPATRIVACDSNPAARNLCIHLAAANDVAIETRGEIGHSDIAAFGPDLVICDIEGGEDALLDPAACPDLAFSDILVEVHEGVRPGLTARLTKRFAASHRITRIDRALDPAGLPDWAEELGDFDRLLMLWEWRSAPTPWLWMQSLKQG